MIYLNVPHYFDGNPLLNYDNPWYLYNMEMGARFLATGTTFWGYDTHFAAGYILDTNFTSSSTLFLMVLACVLGFLSPVVIYKGLTLIALLSFPASYYVGLRLLRRSRSEAFTGAGLGAFFFWNSVNFPIFFNGDPAYILACACSFPAICLFDRLSKRPRFLPLIALVALLFLGYALSPVFLVQTGAVAAFVYAVRFHHIRVNVHLTLLLSALVLFLLILSLLHPTSTYFNSEIYHRVYPLVGVLNESTFLKDFVTAMLLPGNLLPLCVFLTLARRRKLRYSSTDLAFLFGAACMFLLTFIGHQSALGKFASPSRFAASFGFFLVPVIARPINRSLTTVRPTGRTVVHIGLPVIVVACFGVIFYFCWRERARTELSPALTNLVHWIRENTTHEGRILLEDSSVMTGYQYDKSQFSALLPKLTDRTFVSGPRADSGIIVWNAYFADGLLAGKRIESYKQPELEEVTRNYNLDWAVAWSDASITAMRSMPDLFEPLGSIDKFHLFKISSSGGYFLEGEGEVREVLNGLDLLQLKPSANKRIVLAYHYHPWLTAEPDVTIERVLRGNDHMGFIAIENPPEQIRIRCR